MVGKGYGYISSC